MIRIASDLGLLRASLGDTVDSSQLINAIATSLLPPVDTTLAGHGKLLARQTVPSLPSLPNRHLRKLKCGFLNATSLKKHIWKFRQALPKDFSYDIFRAAKSRLDPEVDDGLTQISGYSVLHCDLNTSGKGSASV